MFLLLGITSVWATDEPNSFSIEDATSVDEAVDRITARFEQQGFEVVAVINHSANADRVGLELDPTQVIFFRSLRFENRLLPRSQTIALDFPFKILVYEGTSGIQLKLNIKFNDIGHLIDRHDLRILDFPLGFLNRAQEQFGDLDNGILMVASEQSVANTVASLRAAIEGTKGFAVPFQFEFGAFPTHSSKNPRQSTLLVFGNPNAGTPLMQNRQEIGLDLPQKFLVFEDHEGQVFILYNDPFFIAKRAGIQGEQQRLAAIAIALRRFAEAGASP